MRARRLYTVVAWLLLAGSLSQAAAQGDTYPNKPVRIITHSAAGGAPDVMLRIVGDRLAHYWGNRSWCSTNPAPAAPWLHAQGRQPPLMATRSTCPRHPRS